MNYSNDTIRRQDRLLPFEDALRLLKNGEYGVLSLTSANDGAYGLPISFVWDGENCIYFHCAPQGLKLETLALDNRVSFCVVGKTMVLPSKFTTQYESVIVKGAVEMALSDDQKMRALELILDKYSPEDKIIGMKYTEKSFHRTNIIRLNIETVSGKCKR